MIIVVVVLDVVRLSGGRRVITMVRTAGRPWSAAAGAAAALCGLRIAAAASPEPPAQGVDGFHELTWRWRSFARAAVKLVVRNIILEVRISKIDE